MYICEVNLLKELHNIIVMNKDRAIIFIRVYKRNIPSS